MRRVREYLCSRKRVVPETETDGYQLISASCYGLRRFDGSPLLGCAGEFVTLIRLAETLIIRNSGTVEGKSQENLLSINRG